MLLVFVVLRLVIPGVGIRSDGGGGVFYNFECETRMKMAKL